jgi:UDP-N-acetylmuramoyl-tripeptide--D-alanyl-D-alanine ligase
MKDAIKNAIDTYLSLWVRLVLRSRRPRIVGVTGSVGKTTTKEIIAAVLSHPDARPYVGSVRKSPENLNDNRGLPLTILGYEDWLSRTQLVTSLAVAPLRAFWYATLGRFPDVLVLEYALSEHGDVPWLAALAPPTVAAVTAIGPAHLEHFGTIDRIIEEKGALVRAVPPAGLVVLGSENAGASAMESMSRAPVVKVRGQGRTLSDNVARTVSAYFGIPSSTADAALQCKPPVRGRFDRHDLGAITLFDDSFNANPLSMELGLRTFADQARGDGRKIAILGDMRELGPDAPDYHGEIAKCARSVADIVIGVGDLARYYEPDRWYRTAADCAAQLDALLHSGDAVFVKGSAALELSRVCSAVKAWNRRHVAQPA